MSHAPHTPNTSQLDRYHEFVAGLQKTPPVPTEFKIGQPVAYVNEYGVIFDDMTVMGYADDNEFQGRFIHLNTDCYWMAVHPADLRVIAEDGKYEIRSGEVVYERPVLD